jgi:hypothetical protein
MELNAKNPKKITSTSLSLPVVFITLEKPSEKGYRKIFFIKVFSRRLKTLAHYRSYRPYEIKTTGRKNYYELFCRITHH